MFLIGHYNRSEMKVNILAEKEYLRHGKASQTETPTTTQIKEDILNAILLNRWSLRKHLDDILMDKISTFWWYYRFHWNTTIAKRKHRRYKDKNCSIQKHRIKSIAYSIVCS